MSITLFRDSFTSLSNSQKNIFSIKKRHFSCQISIKNCMRIELKKEEEIAQQRCWDQIINCAHNFFKREMHIYMYITSSIVNSSFST